MWRMSRLCNKENGQGMDSTRGTNEKLLTKLVDKTKTLTLAHKNLYCANDYTQVFVL